MILDAQHFSCRVLQQESLLYFSGLFHDFRCADLFFRCIFVYFNFFRVLSMIFDRILSGRVCSLTNVYLYGQTDRQTDRETVVSICQFSES
jgi:hypothetical protein